MFIVLLEGIYSIITLPAGSGTLEELFEVIMLFSKSS